jgi:ketosteroid isomerase-like protein
MSMKLPEQNTTFNGTLAFANAMKAGDSEGLIGFLTDDVVFMPPADRTLYGKSEVREWVDDYIQYFRILELDQSETSATVLGDVLVERAAVSVKLEPRKDGAPIYDETRILSVWRRQPDGAWKLWQLIWNSIKPIGAGTNRFLVRFMQSRE